MVTRRVLLPSLVATFVLLGSGQARASQWLSPEGRDAGAASVNADVAADVQGDAAAVWLSGAEVRAAYRPRAGAWGGPQNLETALTPAQTQPRVVAQTDGELVAVWMATTGELRWARRPLGFGWSPPATIDTVGTSTTIDALEAGGDGSVAVLVSARAPSTYTKPAGSESWGGAEDLPWTPRAIPGTDLATGPDGSAVAIVPDQCVVPPETTVDCVLAAYRPAGGPWGPEEEAVVLPPLVRLTGQSVAAAPDGTYALLFGEVPSPDGDAPPGSVHSVERSAGSDGSWDADARTVADLTGDAIPDCNGIANCFDIAAGSDGTQVALWQQTSVAGNQISGAVRGGSGRAWGAAQKAGDVSSNAAVPYGAVTATGIPTAAWGSTLEAGNAQASHHDASGWHPVTLDTVPARGGPPAGAVFLGDLAADGEGNALTAWKDGNGVATAGFDGVGPRFTAFSALSGGLTGQVLPFFAAADDTWSGPPALSWSFGDGATAPGASVSHAYGAAGAYSAAVSAVDGVGNVSQHGGGVNITPGPPPPPGDQCGAGDVDKDGVKDGCDTNNGAERPKPFKTVNATVVSGDVFVKLPAGAARASARKAPKGFVRLQGAETIPVGATLDTTHGRVKVRSAADTRKKLQTGQFFRGRFVIRQVRVKKRSRKLITDMRLNGSSFKKACKAKASISAKRKKRSKKRVRRLFGDAKGSFRTSGRNAAATVRGTRWSVQDRCDGTLVTVQRGRVQVRDKVKRKTIIVRTGHKYLARLR